MSARGPFQDKPAIRVEALEISRGGRTLFENLSFAAEGGSFVEIRGANGSGKTSLLRALAGFLRPRAGTIRYEGIEEPGLALHFLGHLNGLKSAASARAHLGYWSGLLGGEDDVRDALDRVGVARAADLPARALSQGQARRVAIARLLLAPRPIWLLDEPAAALDGAGRAMLGGLIASHRAQGGLILAAVHESLGVEPDAVVTVGAA
jgi:heme exporter protein A